MLNDTKAMSRDLGTRDKAKCIRGRGEMCIHTTYAIASDYVDRAATLKGNGKSQMS
jgi:hypothetical protein